MQSGTLHDRALLANLTISGWTARKKDKGASEHTADHYGAQRDRVDAYKQLIKRDAIDPITKHAGAARAYHRLHTLPWAEKGPRILNARTYQQHAEKMATFERKHSELADHFVTIYTDLRDAAQEDLNGMFNADDYPHPDVVRSKFRFDFDVQPIPASGDFRLDVSTEQATILEAQLRETIQRAERRAVQDVYERIAAVVRHMVTKLSDPDAKFHDTLTGNALELAQIVPDLNVMGDPKLNDLARDLERLGSIDPQHLREYQGARKSAADAAQDILNKLV